MHLDLRELGENLRDVLQARPIELDVLPGGEMAVAAVILAGDMGERAQLGRRQEAVGDRHPQHRRVLLDVEAVLQPQRPEFVLGQRARKKAARLVAELRDTLVDDALVEGIVPVHVTPPPHMPKRQLIRRSL